MAAELGTMQVTNKSMPWNAGQVRALPLRAPAPGLGSHASLLTPFPSGSATGRLFPPGGRGRPSATICASDFYKLLATRDLGIARPRDSFSASSSPGGMLARLPTRGGAGRGQSPTSSVVAAASGSSFPTSSLQSCCWYERHGPCHRCGEPLKAFGPRSCCPA